MSDPREWNDEDVGETYGRFDSDEEIEEAQAAIVQVMEEAEILNEIMAGNDTPNGPSA